MSSEKKESPGRSNSDKSGVEVIILECGHGDTILVGLPGNKWALIDCNLPHGRARNHFFKILRDRNVERLDLLCLTHADLDHFRGMGAVVRHFTAPGRSLKRFCDAGVDPKQVYELLLKRARPREPREFADLHRQLSDLIDVKRDFYYRVDENTRSLTLNRGDCSVSLIPIGPTPGRVRESLRAAIADQSVKRSVNAISLVLVLRVESDGRYFNMLLGGDADKEGLERAFEVWSSRTETAPDGSSLSAVKLAHHGSMGSHSTRVCNARARNGAGVAAISVGTRYRVPPDREVMREYLDNGWTVLLTTKRVATRRRQFAIEVAGRPSARREDVQRHDLRITWSPRPEWIGSPKTRRSRHRNSDFMDPRRAAPERTAEARSSKRQVNALRC